MADEDDLFVEAVGEIRPLAPSNKIGSALRKKRKRVVPIKVGTGLINPPRQDCSPERSEDPWRLVADGVSRERLRRLAGGEPPVEYTLDLHGFTRDEAQRQLALVFEAALQGGQRAMRIIHGRGLHSHGKAILKEALYHWLQDGPFAYAVLAAIPEPGSGGGACLVLLRRQGT
ncbi:Smr/MutS family protein [Mariprofundus sp. KV]|uniref:Smr/MutS family protein n=1 Tax=Mariprofundus sp. KV TaxID=2608715 RepID=UPI0015A1361C|nr:Smr/MutS family protein [Mariprofundus sp. KV]NWF36636.1 hypothetical protein [Mariprofundus sp. KV]